MAITPYIKVDKEISEMKGNSFINEKEFNIFRTEHFTTIQKYARHLTDFLSSARFVLDMNVPQQKSLSC